MKSLRTFLPILALAASLAAQGPAPGVAHDDELPELGAFVREATSSLRDEGAGLVVVRGDDVLHRVLDDGLRGDATFAIGPASRWLAVATIMTLVDEGKLDLDLPVGRYLAEFQRPDKQALTLRHCLANTGGLPAKLTDRMRGWDMDRLAAAIAEVGLRQQPDMSFRDGQLGMQVAAAAAMRVTGVSWHQLVENRLVAPLNLSGTGFGAQFPPGADAGKTALPWLATGAVSTIDDYTAFLRMLANQGRVGSKQALSKAAVAEMLRDQVPPLVAVHDEAFPARSLRYGLGVWIEKLGDGGVRVGEPAGLGFSPWFDVELGVAGLFVANVRTSKPLPQVARIQQKVAEVLRSPAVDGTRAAITLDHDGRERRYLLCSPPESATAGRSIPLLVVLHDDKDSGEFASAETGLGVAGVRAGYAVVFADGTGVSTERQMTWNSGAVANYASEHRIDDVGFLRAVVADVARRRNVDPDRVFAVGHGQGGAMCHRLAREAADVFRGIAVYGGSARFEPDQGGAPVAVLMIEGTADRAVRAGFGQGRSRQDAEAAQKALLGYYVKRNELVGYPQLGEQGKVSTQTFAKGRNSQRTQPVRVVTLHGGGHAWPGSMQRPNTPAETPFPFDCNGEILRFFADVAPPPPAAAPAGR
jgi:poly(3-hydroxybutyrate) depolymerase